MGELLSFTLQASTDKDSWNLTTIFTGKKSNSADEWAATTATVENKLRNNAKVCFTAVI